MRKKILQTIFAMSVISTTSFAQITHIDPQPVIDLSKAVIAGRGCTLSDEIYAYGLGSGRAIVDFYPSSLTVGGMSGASTCLVRIPINVPGGYKLKVERQIAYAYADLSSSAKSTISIRASALSPLGIQSKDITPGYEGYVSVGNRTNDAQSGDCNWTTKSGIMRFDLAASVLDQSRFANNHLEIYRAAVVLKLEACN